MGILAWSSRFFFAHLPVIGGLSLFAAAGRAVQMGAIGPIAPGLAWLLEILVEGSRIAVLLYVIGEGSLLRGGRGVAALFRRRAEPRAGERNATEKPARPLGRELGLGLLLFSALALAVNVAAGYFSHHPTVLTTLVGAGIGLQGDNLGEAVRFFIKNLTIIPFTIIFMVRMFCVLAGPSGPCPEPGGASVERPSPPNETGRSSCSTVIPELS